MKAVWSLNYLHCDVLGKKDASARCFSLKKKKKKLSFFSLIFYLRSIMADKKTFDYHSIFCGLSADVGRFRLAQSGMGWKGPRDRTVLISPDDVKRTNWMRVARGYELRVTMKDNVIHKFDGFKSEVSILLNKTEHAIDLLLGF